MSKRRKTKKELELLGTYRNQQSELSNYELKGNKVTKIDVSEDLSENVKEQFHMVTDNLITAGLLYLQDIPSLRQLSEYLREVEYINNRLKLAKEAEDEERVLKLQTQKIKMTRAFTDLGKLFFITPQARNKAITEMAKAGEINRNPAVELIHTGEL
ncbi:MAG: hypothetical protein ACOCRO_04235 [Halanaerobiales bacterium]